MTVEQITSRANPLCTHFRKLAASRSYREAAGEFLCDSPKLLEEAVRWGADIRAVLCTREGALPPLPPGVRTALVPEGVMASVSPMETPQGVVFSCRGADSPLPACLEPGHYLVLDGVQDPGNVGTILRTADAFDCAGVFLLPGCADMYSPKTLRAGMGVQFRRSFLRCTLEELAGLLQGANLPLYAAALGEHTADIRRVDLSRAAVVIGSEGRGVSQAVLDRCAGRLHIPMSPQCESLNAAAAAAVILWEMARTDGGRWSG